MYQASHVIYTIIKSVSPDILINLFQCPIPLEVHIEPVLQSNPSEHGIRVLLFERESDQIAIVPDVNIIGLLNVSCIGSE